MKQLKVLKPLQENTRRNYWQLRYYRLVGRRITCNEYFSESFPRLCWNYGITKESSWLYEKGKTITEEW